MVEVCELLSRANEMELLDSLESGEILYQEAPLQLGDSERALIQFAMEAVRNRESVCIISPINGDELPLLSVLAFRLNSQSNLGFGHDLPVLLFAKRGYLGAFSEFSYAASVNTSELLPREVFDPSEFTIDNPLYSTLKADALEFDRNQYIGNVFVDLRNDLWRTNLSSFARFNENNRVCSYIFYTDATDRSAQLTDQIAGDHITVTRDWLTSVDCPHPTDYPETTIRKYERILNSPISVELNTVSDAEFMNGLKSLYSAHKEIQSEIPRYIPTGHLFKELSGVVTPPSVFDRVAGQSYIQPKISDLIQRIRTHADSESTADASLLAEFVDDADDLIAHLEDENLKWNVLLRTLTEIQESGTSATVVTRSEAHTNAIKAYFDQTGYDIPPQISFTSAANVGPNPDEKMVLLGLLPQSSTLYEFPPSTDLHMIVYPTEVAPIERQITGTGSDTDPLDLTITETETHIDSDSEPVSFDMDDFNESLAEAVLDSDPGPSTSSSSGSRPRNTTTYALTDDHGNTETYPGSRNLTVYNPGSRTVTRVPVSDLEAGSQVVRLDDARDDLYDFIKRKEIESGDLGEKEKLVSHWREALRDLESETSPATIVTELRDRGSSVSSEQTVEYWITGHTIGPQDIEDVRRTLAIARPDLIGLHEQVYRAMEYLRTFDKRVRQLTRELIEDELDPTKSLNVEDDLRQKIIQLRENVEVVEITNVRKHD